MTTLRCFSQTQPDTDVEIRAVPRTKRQGDFEVLVYEYFIAYYETDALGSRIHYITRFGRQRDAWRALRRLGYVQEGKVWRVRPKALAYA